MSSKQVRLIICSFQYSHIESVSIGSSLGTLEGIDMGLKLIRGSWNVQLWGPLEEFFNDGWQNGTDTLFYKSIVQVFS